MAARVSACISGVMAASAAALSLGAMAASAAALSSVARVHSAVLVDAGAEDALFNFSPEDTAVTEAEDAVAEAEDGLVVETEECESAGAEDSFSAIVDFTLDNFPPAGAAVAEAEDVARGETGVEDASAASAGVGWDESAGVEDAFSAVPAFALVASSSAAFTLAAAFSAAAASSFAFAILVPESSVNLADVSRSAAPLSSEQQAVPMLLSQVRKCPRG